MALKLNPGNFFNGNAIKLTHHLFLIPWVGGSGGISYCRRGYSSSLPVRYIPKKSVKENGNVPNKSVINDVGNDAHLHVNDLNSRHNELELHESRVGILNHTNSSRNFCNVDSHGLNWEVEEEVEVDLIAGDDEVIEDPKEVVDDRSKRINGFQSGQSREDVEKLAVNLLASRALTAQELKKKLLGKRFPFEIIDAVITDFQSRGLINDSLYAETYCRSRWSSSSWGPRRVRQALSKKGLNEADIDNATKLVFKNGGDHDSGTSMSKLSIDQLYTQASKQWQRSFGVPQETRKARLVRWLQYRGFNWDVVKSILKKLEAESSS